MDGKDGTGPIFQVLNLFSTIAGKPYESRYIAHSRPQSPRSFWSAPRIEKVKEGESLLGNHVNKLILVAYISKFFIIVF